MGSLLGRSLTGDITSNTSQPCSKPNGAKVEGTAVNIAVRPLASLTISDKT
jgi:hypothetical protein